MNPERQQLAEGLADIPTGPCPATATEFDGSIMRCVLPGGHTDLHTDGCVEWTDPYGEIDADQHPEVPERRDRIDLDDAGMLDDVSLAATHFRLERMDEGHWWLSVTRPDGSRFVVNLATKRPMRTAILASYYEEKE